MSGHLTTTLLAAVALDLALAATAAAGTLTYVDDVLRYRDLPGDATEISIESFRPAQPDGTPGRLTGSATAPLVTGPGCSAVPSEALGYMDDFVCAVTTQDLPHYRLSLGDRRDEADISPRNPTLRGVVYTGPGPDRARGSVWQVYGGGGDDWIAGLMAYGGRGNDEVEDVSFANSAGVHSVLRGGPGNDKVTIRNGPGWGYGGPGNDDLVPSRRFDMLVGGPGFDEIVFLDDRPRPDRFADVFRIRDGGHDYVECPESSDEKDIFFADRSDTFNDAFSESHPDRCGDSRVLFSGRPRVFF